MSSSNSERDEGDDTPPLFPEKGRKRAWSAYVSSPPTTRAATTTLLLSVLPYDEIMFLCTFDATHTLGARWITKSDLMRLMANTTQQPSPPTPPLLRPRSNDHIPLHLLAPHFLFTFDSLSLSLSLFSQDYRIGYVDRIK